MYLSLFCLVSLCCVQLFFSPNENSEAQNAYCSFQELHVICLYISPDSGRRLGHSEEFQPVPFCSGRREAFL